MNARRGGSCQSCGVTASPLGLNRAGFSNGFIRLPASTVPLVMELPDFGGRFGEPFDILPQLFDVNRRKQSLNPAGRPTQRLDLANVHLISRRTGRNRW